MPSLRVVPLHRGAQTLIQDIPLEESEYYEKKHEKKWKINYCVTSISNSLYWGLTGWNSTPWIPTSPMKLPIELNLWEAGSTPQAECVNEFLYKTLWAVESFVVNE